MERKATKEKLMSQIPNVCHQTFARVVQTSSQSWLYVAVDSRGSPATMTLQLLAGFFRYGQNNVENIELDRRLCRATRDVVDLSAPRVTRRARVPAAHLDRVLRTATRMSPRSPTRCVEAQHTTKLH